MKMVKKKKPTTTIGKLSQQKRVSKRSGPFSQCFSLSMVSGSTGKYTPKGNVTDLSYMTGLGKDIVCFEDPSRKKESFGSIVSCGYASKHFAKCEQGNSFQMKSD